MLNTVGAGHIPTATGVTIHGVMVGVPLEVDFTDIIILLIIHGVILGAVPGDTTLIGRDITTVIGMVGITMAGITMDGINRIIIGITGSKAQHPMPAIL
jgi:hypothetical protein